MTHAELLQLRADIDSFLERWAVHTAEQNRLMELVATTWQSAMDAANERSNMIKHLISDIVPRINQAIAQSDDSNSADWWKQ